MSGMPRFISMPTSSAKFNGFMMLVLLIFFQSPLSMEHCAVYGYWRGFFVFNTFTIHGHPPLYKNIPPLMDLRHNLQAFAHSKWPEHGLLSSS